MKQLTPYLNFDGQCGEAMKFYAKCLGGDLHAMPFSQMPGDYPPAAKDRIMHAALTGKTGPTLMASDTMPGSKHQVGNNFSVVIPCESREEIERVFSDLAEGGEITMALHDAFWGARFGMLKDRFGVHWMLSYELPKSQ